jgi:hypothetical protein
MDESLPYFEIVSVLTSVVLAVSVDCVCNQQCCSETSMVIIWPCVATSSQL